MDLGDGAIPIALTNPHRKEINAIHIPLEMLQIDTCKETWVKREFQKVNVLGKND